MVDHETECQQFSLNMDNSSNSPFLIRFGKSERVCRKNNVQVCQVRTLPIYSLNLPLQEDLESPMLVDTPTKGLYRLCRLGNFQRIKTVKLFLTLKPINSYQVNPRQVLQLCADVLFFSTVRIGIQMFLKNAWPCNFLSEIPTKGVC